MRIPAVTTLQVTALALALARPEARYLPCDTITRDPASPALPPTPPSAFSVVASAPRLRAARARGAPPRPPFLAFRASAGGDGDDGDGRESERGEGNEGGEEPREEDRRSSRNGDGGDWRDFRARLVLRERGFEGDAADGVGGSTRGGGGGGGGEGVVGEWAYESGRTIERGSVVLGRPSPNFGYGLRQQYLHKAVVLVLDHDDREFTGFTRGLLMNRPTGVVMSDDRGDGEWRVWFGGEVQGLHSEDTEYMCLHSIQSDAADAVSTLVMQDIKYCTFEHAKDLVRAGQAAPEDFWLFAGYCGWVGGQLMAELAADSWITVATDSRTLLKELSRQSTDADPGDAGIDTWARILGMLGGREDSSSPSGGDDGASDELDDAMLRAWARKRLRPPASDGGGGGRDGSRSSSGSSDPIDGVLGRAAAAGGIDAALVRPGSIVRASSRVPSPFLLSGQDMHKSVVLITDDNAHGTIGAVLNRPTSRTVDLRVPLGGSTNEALSVPFVQRYGGSHVVWGEGERPVLWLHRSEALCEAGVGMPLSSSGEGIRECTAEEVAGAISDGLASPRDFMMVSGGFIWAKFQGGKVGGMRGQIWDGTFEVAPPGRTKEIWDLLLSQELLSTTNVDRNLGIANLSWELAGNKTENESSDVSAIALKGHSAGGEEDSSREDEELQSASSSEVQAPSLADAALRRWVAMYMLNAPRLE